MWRSERMIVWENENHPLEFKRVWWFFYVFTTIYLYDVRIISYSHFISWKHVKWKAKTIVVMNGFLFANNKCMPFWVCGGIRQGICYFLYDPKSKFRFRILYILHDSSIVWILLKFRPIPYSSYVFAMCKRTLVSDWTKKISIIISTMINRIYCISWWIEKYQSWRNSIESDQTR